MAGALDWVQYVSDNGTTYRMRMDDGNATAVGAADEADPPTHAILPRNIEPRYLLAEFLSDPNGDGTDQRLERRKVYCPDPTEAVWTGGTNSITLKSYNSPSAGAGEIGGVDKTFTVRGRVGEKRYDR